jgi:predicted NBD/HSP70 family sugar kinase
MQAGKPQHIKLNNEALIREALLSSGEATTAEIVAETGLSQTTVGQILDEMRREGIVSRAGKRAADVGRPAAAWGVDPGAWTSIAIAVELDALYWALADSRGAIRDQGSRSFEGDQVDASLGLAAELAASARRESDRVALALGLPGAVKDGRLITGHLAEDWADVDLQRLFSLRIGAPVFAENDLNSIALGYARAAEANGERIDSLAYIHFNGGACIGSGLVVGGRIMRGASSFSGELGFLPMGDGKILDDVIPAVEGDDGRYAEAIVRALATVNCVINPALVVIGGRGFRFELERLVRESLAAAVDERVRPRLAFVPQSLPYYLAGLVGLAAERVFPDIRLNQA